MKVKTTQHLPLASDCQCVSQASLRIQNNSDGMNHVLTGPHGGSGLPATPQPLEPASTCPLPRSTIRSRMRELPKVFKQQRLAIPTAGSYTAMSQLPSTPTTLPRPPKRAHEEELVGPAKRQCQHRLWTPPEHSNDFRDCYTQTSSLYIPQ